MLNLWLYSSYKSYKQNGFWWYKTNEIKCIGEFKQINKNEFPHNPINDYRYFWIPKEKTPIGEPDKYKEYEAIGLPYTKYELRSLYLDDYLLY